MLMEVLLIISIRIVGTINRNRCTVLHFSRVVSDAGRFVDAAGGYSHLDSYCFVFRTGTR